MELEVGMVISDNNLDWTGELLIKQLPHKESIYSYLPSLGAPTLPPYHDSDASNTVQTIPFNNKRLLFFIFCFNLCHHGIENRLF